MSISGVDSSARYNPGPVQTQSDSTKPATVTTGENSASRPSTIVTLGNISSEVSVYGGSLSSMPLSVASAPELFVQGDSNGNDALSLQEFTEQLKRIGVSSGAAAQLFDSLNVSKNKELSLDDFVNGVIAANANGDEVFQQLFASYTSDASGDFNTEKFSVFKSAGAAVAAHYWQQHPELQQRS